MQEQGLTKLGGKTPLGHMYLVQCLEDLTKWPLDKPDGNQSRLGMLFT